MQKAPLLAQSFGAFLFYRTNVTVLKYGDKDPPTLLSSVL